MYNIGKINYSTDFPICFYTCSLPLGMVNDCRIGNWLITIPSDQLTCHLYQNTQIFDMLQSFLIIVIHNTEILFMCKQNIISTCNMLHDKSKLISEMIILSDSSNIYVPT